MIVYKEADRTPVDCPDGFGVSCELQLLVLRASSNFWYIATQSAGCKTFDAHLRGD
jgi:hypothetical protein